MLSVVRPFKAHLRSGMKRLDLTFAQVAAHFYQADIALFHEFQPPPSGGGHQFMRALRSEFERKGLRIENNRISATTRICLYNSLNFDFDRLRYLHRPNVKMVHRVDGPITVYRGYDDSSDRRIWNINRELADATIFQSRYSLEKHLELGMEFRNPVIIMNTADPTIFHDKERITFDQQRKIRLISTSWSDNINKGAQIYQWLDENLDWERFDYTFVGRSPTSFRHIRMIAPLESHQLADLLRQHDIFITASRNDPCSNSLIEALVCGLPAIYFKSGGHPEIVGQAGFGFCNPEEIPFFLDQLVTEYETRQALISLPTLAEVAAAYLKVMDIYA